MISTSLSPKITLFSANDHQLTKFESLWDIPQGVSYNCYLINDKKTALIDTVEQSFGTQLLELLQNTLYNKPLDYLVINHMEPDHSGTISLIKKKYPQVSIVGNHKTAGFLEGFYHISSQQMHEVKTGDQLKLGEHQLEFLQTPMLHWPESMVCFELNTQTLFSSDIFGGFKTIDKQPLADLQKNLDEYVNQARTYFATVLGGHTRPARKNLQKIKTLKINIIAPAHGLVWQKSHSRIFELYNRWSQYQTDDENLGVAVVVGSMYSHTLQTGQLIVDHLQQSDAVATLIDVAHTSLTEQLNQVWKHRGLIIGSCTYNNGLFPPIKNLLDALTERKITNKLLGIFSSHSWTGGAMRRLQTFAQESRLKLLEPQFQMQYQMDEERKLEAIKLAENMSEELKNFLK